MTAAAERELLAIPQLEDLWSRILAQRSGARMPSREMADEAARFDRDKVVMFGLGLGLRETLSFLYDEAPSFEAFAHWIVQRNGGSIDPAIVARINAALSGQEVEPLDDGTAALTPAELAFFDEHGYVVVRSAVAPEAARAAEEAIWNYLRMDPADPNTWYAGQNGNGIWVPFLRHPALDANRASPRIAAAFAQLWRRRDLWRSVDQCGFKPPERAGWSFPGQSLHWDVSLAPPIPFGVQGILYLTDTAADQGAFTCVPGFHRRIDDWLGGLAPGANPRCEDLYALGPMPVAAGAGDMVIWHHALPHGASPNRASRPRIVQYITLAATSTDHSSRWE